MTKFTTLTEIISQRKAIRNYALKKIPASLIKKIIQIATRAPSWYGLEPWFILVIDKKKIKSELYSFINQQEQILNCSHLFLLLSYRGESFNWETELFKEKVLWKYDRLTLDNYSDFVHENLKNFAPGNYQWISNWAQQQCFILLPNFLLLFTSLNIATCPIGGFQKEKVLEYLEKQTIIPHNYYNLAVIFTAGFSNNEKEWTKKIKKRNWEKVYKIL
jgi:nitroreductase